MNTSSFKRASFAALILASLAACTTMAPEGPERAEKAVAVTASNKLLKFNAGRPGRILTTLNITGLQAGETLLGIDYRVAKDQLYALGSSGRLYTVNEDTAIATVVGMPFAFSLKARSLALTSTQRWTVFGWSATPDKTCACTLTRARLWTATRRSKACKPTAN